MGGYFLYMARIPGMTTAKVQVADRVDEPSVDDVTDTLNIAVHRRSVVRRKGRLNRSTFSYANHSRWHKTLRLPKNADVKGMIRWMQGDCFLLAIPKKNFALPSAQT